MSERGIYVGGQGHVATPGVSPVRRFLDEAETHGWTMEVGGAWHRYLLHEDGTHLWPVFVRGSLTGGTLFRAPGENGLRLSPQEVRACIRGKRCQCPGGGASFSGEQPIVPGKCPFSHPQLRVDLDVWRRLERKALEDGAALQERRSA